MNLYPALPLAATASTGPLIAVALAPYSLSHALISIAFGIVLEVFALSFLFMLTTMYFYRLIVHGYPGGASVVSMFLTISSFAQPGVTMVYLGQVFHDLFPLQNSNSPFLTLPGFGDTMYALCIAWAMCLWSTLR